MPDSATTTTAAAGLADVGRDLAVAAAGSKVTYTGAGVSSIGWLFSNEFAVLAGVLIGLAGFAVNWHYRRKSEARMARVHEMREREHEVRMQRLRLGMGVESDVMGLDD